MHQVNQTPQQMSFLFFYKIYFLEYLLGRYVHTGNKGQVGSAKKAKAEAESRAICQNLVWTQSEPSYIRLYIKPIFRSKKFVQSYRKYS